MFTRTSTWPRALIRLAPEVFPREKTEDFCKMDAEIDNLGFYSGHNEELEAECVLRARSILDEYVCPEMGLAIQTSQRHLLLGVRKLWSLSMEMRRLDDEIRQRLVTLPLLFIVILLYAVEQEYLDEEQGKQAADSQSAEILLQLFYEVHDKLPAFKGRKSTRIVTKAIFTYIRYLVTLFGAGGHVKSFSYINNSVESGQLKAPLRPGDLANALLCMRHLRDKILPVFTRGKVCYRMTIKAEVLDIMEPTREDQLEWSGILNSISAAMIAFGAVVFCIVILTQMFSIVSKNLGERPTEKKGESNKPQTGPPAQPPHPNPSNPQNPDNKPPAADNTNNVLLQPPKSSDPSDGKAFEDSLKNGLKSANESSPTADPVTQPAAPAKKELKDKNRTK